MTADPFALSPRDARWHLSELKFVIMAGMATWMLAGCAQKGPGATATSHIAYNEAVQNSAQQELLLNLVRLRYHDAPEFLEVSSISTQMSFEGSVAVGAEMGTVEGNHTRMLAPGANFGYSEKPTLTFTPQRSSQFTRQLVAPVGLGNIYLLTHYGWSLDRVLRLIAKDINGLSNHLGREQVSANELDHLKVFKTVSLELGQFWTSGQLSLTVEDVPHSVFGPFNADTVSPALLIEAMSSGLRFDYSAGDGGYKMVIPEQRYWIRLSPSAAQSENWPVIAQTLHLAVDTGSFELASTAGTAVGQDKSRLAIDTRSLLGVMSYLSQAVMVPDQHLKAGLAGTLADLQPTMADLLEVAVTDQRPPDAFLTVPYRGYWFYIRMNDLSSRNTLGLLTSLFRLQITTGGVGNVPVLTLPVS